jgi:chlorite dismutase
MASDRPEALTPATGQGVLHLFTKATPLADRAAVEQAVKGAEAAGLQVVPVALLGHKADLGIMVLGPDLWQLRALQSELASAGLDVVDSYVSLTELSEYAQAFPTSCARPGCGRSSRPRASARGASIRCRSAATSTRTGSRCPTTSARP